MEEVSYQYHLSLSTTSLTLRMHCATESISVSLTALGFQVQECWSLSTSTAPAIFPQKFFPCFHVLNCSEDSNWQSSGLSSTSQQHLVSSNADHLQTNTSHALKNSMSVKDMAHLNLLTNHQLTHYLMLYQ